MPPQYAALRAQLHQQLLAQRQFGLDVVHTVVGAEFGELCRRIGRVLESAEVIHQADALRIDARPDAPLRDLVHVLHALLAAFADAAQELRIGVIDGALQDLPRRAPRAAVEAHVARERSGADAVHLDAEFLQRVLEGRHHREHADRAGQRGRTREDLIGCRGDVVAARGRIRAHRDHDGLAGFAQRLHLAQDLFGGEHAAARAVDAQHHRFDGVVVARLAQQVGGTFAADHARRLMAVEDLAGGDHDADLGIGFGFQDALGAHRREILCHPDGIERMRVLILAHDALQLVGDLPTALQRGDQAALQRELGGVAVDGGQRRGLLAPRTRSRALAGRERARVTSCW